MAHAVLAGYEPAATLAYFEEICAIPHVSGDERALADYVETFARARGLYVYRDAADNVFIRREASTGYASAPTVLLQGHLDMVGEKTSDSLHDFATDGLCLRVSPDGWISATDTTLGGDDGIAVAMMLALLDSPPEPHPAMECLFTVSEEVGLEGAWAFDPTAAGVTARTMINLDSENEGVLTAGCAGGMRTDIRLPVTTEPAPADTTALSVCLSGLSGGHSGVEIHEGHTNAIKLLARLLRALPDARLCTIMGGGKDNAIPRDATAVLLVSSSRAAAAKSTLLAEAERVRTEPHLMAVDRRFVCTVDDVPTPAICLDASSDSAVRALLDHARDGVLAMNAHVKGLVAYSRNLGVVQTQTSGDIPTDVRFTLSTRSAVEGHLDDAERELDSLASLIPGATATHRARYPGWNYAPVSPLRDLWTTVSQDLYGVTPHIEVIHAGLECGILSAKLPGMDIISVGQDMQDIHTPTERLSIPSVERTQRLVEEVIRRLAAR